MAEQSVSEPQHPDTASTTSKNTQPIALLTIAKVALASMQRSLGPAYSSTISVASKNAWSSAPHSSRVC
jgi:hypothetical protein